MYLEKISYEELEYFLNINGIFVADVPLTREYWFIRTYSGQYFDVFLHNNAIAVGWKCDEHYDRDGHIAVSMRERGWNIITKGKYSCICPHNEDFLEQAARNISSAISAANKKKEINLYYLSPEEREFVLAASSEKAIKKILRFEKIIGKGDVVVIPSINCGKVMIGEVISDVIHTKLSNEAYKLTDEFTVQFPSYRVRRVKWLHEYPIAVKTLNPKIIPLLCSQHGITRATELYSAYIDQAIYPIYKKNNTFHLNIPVITNRNFNTRSYYGLFDLAEFIRSFATEILATNKQRNDLNTKISIQSPGIIEFLSQNPSLIFFLASCVLCNTSNVRIFLKRIKDNTGILNKICETAIEIYSTKRYYDLEEQKMYLDKGLLPPSVAAKYAKKPYALRDTQRLIKSLRLDKHAGVRNTKPRTEENDRK